MVLSIMVALTRHERLEAMYRDLCRDMIHRLWDFSASVWEIEQANLSNSNDAESLGDEDVGGVRL
jgi:hypothetical protein